VTDLASRSAVTTGLTALGLLAPILAVVLALALPFHDHCGPSLLHVACIGDGTCPSIVCSGWGSRSRAVVGVVGLSVGIVAWIAVMWIDRPARRA
jgi:hypothetical protein